MTRENMNIWMSETDWSDTLGEDAGEMGAALWLSKKIISDINALSPSAWVIWLTIDHHKSKDGWHGIADSGFPSTENGYWGLAFAEHDEKKIYLSKKYYAMGQFSRYIRPGDTIIHCDADTLGAYNKENNKLTIVCVNDKKADIEKTIDISDFKKHSGNVKVIRTSGSLADGENWKELPCFEFTNGKFNYTLKGNSITTLIINNKTNEVGR